MPGSESLIFVSPLEIVISMAPLALVAWVSYVMGLDIESPILVGTIRTYIQLSILGFILETIFVRGEKLWWLVIGYCVLMTFLASYEASVRSKYYVDGQFWMVLLPIVTNIAVVSIFAFCLILKPEPRWDPQYVIPIVGMLLGNCINGVSLALNHLLTSFVESSREVELLLSFGANSYEATARLMREAVRTGAMPQLNGMAIIGIISIPGMMTGQILGGTSVLQAARYQILIMYFIALSSFGTILMQLYLALQVCFDSRTILRTDLLLKRDKKPTFLAMIGSICNSIWRKISLSLNSPRRQSSTFSLRISDESTYLAPQGILNVSTSSREERKSGEAVLRVDKLSYGFEKVRDEERGDPASWSTTGDNTTFRMLFENISFELCRGGTALVIGPSGVGKSTLLRIIAGLTEAESEKIVLNGTPQSSFMSMPLWRKQVRYVPQTKVDIPGTPNDFIARITSFKTWKTDHGGNTPTLQSMSSATRDLIRSWNMNSSLLDSEWKMLSGGESQRMLVAISLASLPSGGVVLLDESTSALDVESKLKVEDSVKEYCANFGVVAIWISHDPGQQDRMKLI